MSVLSWILDVSWTTVIGMAFLAFLMGAVAGFFHRLYMNKLVPFYMSIIVGLGTVGLWINSSTALITFVSNLDPATTPLPIQHIETNTITAIIGTLTAYSGGRVGDVLAPNIQALVGAQAVDREVSKLVRTVGRFITVTIPDDIEDMEDYEPVTPEIKEKLAGTDLVFPRGLTVDELRDRLTTRLREDYGVGYVDVELDETGKVLHFAIGSRAAGIGPTLPPRRVALGLKANPAPKASPGDRVQLWSKPSPPEEAAPSNESESTEPSLPPILDAHPERWYRPRSDKYEFAVRTPEGDRRYVSTAEEAATLLERFYGESSMEVEPPGPERVAMAELRATNGDVATLMVDVARLDDLDQAESYWMVTLPAQKRPEREFAALLRTANVTMESPTVESESELVGVPIRAIKPTIIALKSQTDTLETLPKGSRVLEAGDTLYGVGRPDELRKLSTFSSG